MHEVFLYEDRQGQPQGAGCNLESKRGGMQARKQGARGCGGRESHSDVY